MKSRWRKKTWDMAIRHVKKDQKQTITELAKSADVGLWWLHRFIQNNEGNESIVLVNRLHDYLEKQQ
jgi:hypothetical protein